MIVQLTGDAYEKLLKSEKVWVLMKEHLTDGSGEKICAWLNKCSDINFGSEVSILELSFSTENKILIKGGIRRMQHGRNRIESSHFLVMDSEFKSILGIVKDGIDCKVEQLKKQMNKLTECSDAISKMAPATKNDPPKEIKLPPKNNPPTMGDRPC